MTLDKAIKLLEKEYARAKTLKYIRNPIAWALYRVWKLADAELGMVVLDDFDEE